MEIAGWLGKSGIEKVHPLNHGGPSTFDFGKARAVNAIHSSSFVKCGTVVGIHYNTWPGIAIDMEKAKANFSAAGKKLLLPNPGETIEV